LREHFNKPSNNHREFRLADQIQKELASLFHLEVKDPRINFITITDVELTVDLSLAKVFYSTFPSDSERLASTQEGLEAVVGFLRSKISKSIRLHHAPELKFIYDDSLERGRFLSNLIEEACHKPYKKN
jgi:ribosome-binding factor A